MSRECLQEIIISGHSKRKNSRRHYKKNLNLHHITGRRQSILASIYPMGATVCDVEEEKYRQLHLAGVWRSEVYAKLGLHHCANFRFLVL